ncbi:hypothetical protein [uncultured Ruthenibacterium sp.]|uniref:putative ABC transporter permease n=1 Tax=uncultured Ruthenibacterium sp. TaxID=1905347 RepID=UPI00349E626D
MKKQTAIFSTGAIGYSLIEILARGYTHWTMTILGGLCLLGLYSIAVHLGTNIFFQAAAGMWLITAAEFATGVIVNLLLDWQVWDYSAEPANLLGQICLRYCFYWFCLCFLWFLAIRIMRRIQSTVISKWNKRRIETERGA